VNFGLNLIKKMKASDDNVMRCLMHQVAKAAGRDTERNTKTIITRPMWNSFCRAVRMPENSEPTEWLGAKKTRRVYGSETIVIESDEMFAVTTKKWNSEPTEKPPRS